MKKIKKGMYLFLAVVFISVLFPVSALANEAENTADFFGGVARSVADNSKEFVTLVSDLFTGEEAGNNENAEDQASFEAKKEHLDEKTIKTKSVMPAGSIPVLPMNPGIVLSDKEDDAKGVILAIMDTLAEQLSSSAKRLTELIEVVPKSDIGSDNTTEILRGMSNIQIPTDWNITDLVNNGENMIPGVIGNVDDTGNPIVTGLDWLKNLQKETGLDWVVMMEKINKIMEDFGLDFENLKNKADAYRDLFGAFNFDEFMDWLMGLADDTMSKILETEASFPPPPPPLSAKDLGNPRPPVSPTVPGAQAVTPSAVKGTVPGGMSSPKTGDKTDMLINTALLLMALISGAGIALLLRPKKHTVCAETANATAAAKTLTAYAGREIGASSRDGCANTDCVASLK